MDNSDGLASSRVSNSHYKNLDKTDDLMRSSIAFSAMVEKNERIFVPLRFISQELGAKVEWQADTHKVFLTLPKDKPSTPVEKKD